MEDDEFKKLPIDERCVHKLWKARVNGYEEVTKLFRQIDEKSPEFGKYLGLVKKFVIDSNAMGQEKGLEATLAFVENYAHAGKTVGEVMSGIVSKCMAAPKTKTRELALQITLMYIEIEKHEIVVEELIKGMELKNPKIVSACINATTTGLREFGSKVIAVKPLVKKIPVLFADRDKNVRDEARLLVVEMYRWIGAALRPQLSNLQPVQVAELETEFSKVEGQKAVPTRYLKSQQEKQAKLAVEAQEAEDVAEDEEDEEDQVVLDPYEIADPVDILSKLPKDFYDKLEAKKWQERKEALEVLENLLKAPKLENGDYGDMIRSLKRIIQKDSNVIVVALAAKCLASVANGLKKRFQTYASACIPALLEKFKEKKQNVVNAVRDAADAVYLATTLENILEDVLEALVNKNPSVKSETALFLARSLTKTLPAVLNKKLLKAITAALIKLINEPDPGVRDSSAEALGTLMKLVGEKAVGPFLIELEKDAIKMGKIKEFSEKAVIVVKVPGAKKERPVTAPPKSAPKIAEPAKATSAPAKSKRATTATKKKPVGEISSGTATIVKSKGGKASSNKAPAKPVEREMSEEEVSEIVADIMSAEIISGLTDANWKTRLNAVEQYLIQIQTLESANMPTQALVKMISKKPGLKDTNFQVLKGRLDVVKYLAENGNFSITTAGFCTNEITEKLGDAKNGNAAGEALIAIAEATSLAHVSSLVLDFAFTQKSPKVLQEAINWMGNAIKDFGFTNLNAKYLIDNAKKALASNNATVRSAAITFFGVLYLYMGANLHMFLENEKPALREQINQEFDKHENEKPPTPTRGIVKSASSNSLDAEEDEEAGGDAPVVNLQDLLPRIDISSQISEALINEMADKNWKVRNEALIKVAAIITEAKLIKPNIGDLPQALALRLVDSNSKIAQTALNICENIATSMGPPCKQHIRTLFPGFLQGLGDGKAWIRSSSVNCMNAFGDQCGYKDFFEGEMVGDALKGGSPTLRCELWAWLAEKLPKIKSVPKEEMMICIPYLFSNMEDRNADVRKNANEAVLGIMIHVGYESMAKQLEKLKPGSKTVVMAALEKARPNLPAKPVVAKKKDVVAEEKVVRGTRPVSTSKNAVKPRASTVPKAPARKKDEDVDMSPLLAVNNLKHQRSIDEAKLKVLKWNFTTPREEFVDLLKDQMTTANMNKTLTTNMFHSDFKFHIKAIESLMEDLQENSQALISNLDLILKWLTLRFFDTNPSVLLKGLEYLHTVFNMLIDNQYQLLDNEASSFIPYLILKIGDPKDAVRNGVKSLILKQIGVVYSMSKIFTYLMDGVKSKNARQRAECLDTMAAIIPDFGISVCLPSPAACLKEIAKQISDRDNAVRNAALNFAVQAYYIVGDKVYKMVGNISDKDMSLLEERIKRASKKPPPAKPKLDTTHPINIATMSPVKEHHSPAKSNSSNAEHDVGNGEDDIEEEDEEELPGMNLPPQVVQQEPEELPGPYRLDPDHIRELDSMAYKLPEPKLQKFDLAFLNEPIIMPTIEDARAKVMPLSPPKPILPTDTFVSSSSKTGDELLLEKAISQISSPDYVVVNKSLEQIQEILQSSKNMIMLDYEDKFMSAIAVQLKRLAPLDPAHNHVLKMYRCILTVIDSFYVSKSLGLKVSTPVFKEVLNQFIIVLVDGKLEECPNGDAYIRVVNLNCVKIIERSDHTTVLCGLVQLLYGCIKNSSSPRLTELVMKCLWRVIKLLPNWAAEIDYDSVLLEVHLFLKDFPTAWWKTKAVDTPLRTVKTVIHSMAKIKGATIMTHLTKVPNTNDSEMETYMLKLLKSLKIDEVKAVPLKTDAGRRPLSRSTHTQLTEIFQKIGSKEETTEGLVQLYDFQQQNPDADIEPFLKKSSQFFQEYIQKNLQEIETSRKRLADTKTKPCAKINNEQPSEGSEKDADYYRGRLNYWMKIWDEKLG